MNTTEIILLSFGLAMDAFAVSICKGLSTFKNKFKTSIIVGLYFGIFQGIMPLLGSFLGLYFSDYTNSYSHYISFGLLLILGLNMIKESNEEIDNINSNLNFFDMIFLSIATSIDALSIGITFTFLNVNIYKASSIIAIITFITSFLGCLFGSKFGTMFKSKSDKVGGIILILIGAKILIEHLI